MIIGTQVFVWWATISLTIYCKQERVCPRRPIKMPRSSPFTSRTIGVVSPSSSTKGLTWLNWQITVCRRRRVLLLLRRYFVQERWSTIILQHGNISGNRFTARYLTWKRLRKKSLETRKILCSFLLEAGELFQSREWCILSLMLD